MLMKRIDTFRKFEWVHIHMHDKQVMEKLHPKIESVDASEMRCKGGCQVLSEIHFLKVVSKEAA